MDFIGIQREKLEHALKKTIEKCIDQELLKVEPVQQVQMEVPRSVEHGHLATNLALVLNKDAGRYQKIALVNYQSYPCI